jgi:hypothetical protein
MVEAETRHGRIKRKQEDHSVPSAASPCMFALIVLPPIIPTVHYDHAFLVQRGVLDGRHTSSSRSSTHGDQESLLARSRLAAVAEQGLGRWRRGLHTSILTSLWPPMPPSVEVQGSTDLPRRRQNGMRSRTRRQRKLSARVGVTLPHRRSRSGHPDCASLVASRRLRKRKRNEA